VTLNPAVAPGAVLVPGSGGNGQTAPPIVAQGQTPSVPTSGNAETAQQQDPPKKKGFFHRLLGVFK
jgi:hypothetical protein